MPWRKVWTVASTEFNNAVRTKAFLVSILMLPIIYALMIGVQVYASRSDVKTRTIAVIDHTGKLTPALLMGIKAYNEGPAVWEKPGDAKSERKQVRPKIEFEPIDLKGRPIEEVRLDLSNKVRNAALSAFVELPAEILDPAKTGPQLDDKAVKLHYFTNAPTEFEWPRIVEGLVSAAVMTTRMSESGLDPIKVTQAMTPVRSDTLSLINPDGSSGNAGSSSDGKVDLIRTLGPPVALIAVMFITIMSTTPQMMQSVLEEKMSKISEVLLGSVSPFQLMLGKLLGSVGVALLLAVLYLGTALAVAVKYGYGDLVRPDLLAAAVLFLFLGVLLFGSLFMAIGSACNDLKDAQSLMFPVMMLAMLPAILWSIVLRQPNSPMAVGASLFPPATPFLMLMRMALTPPPPAWQVGLGVALTTLTAVACVWAAGKIFRTGLLMSGKAPSFAELAKWVVAK